MAKKFETLGVMMDLSRNAVTNVESVKRFLSVIRKMGYNTAEELNKRLMEQIHRD